MHRANGALLVMVGALATVTLTACSEVCDCAALVPFISVSVIDTMDGGPIFGARVNDLPCPGTCAFTGKPDGGPAAGPVDLTVTATSYQSKSLTVVIPATEPVDQGCCGVGPPWIGQFVTVPLQPL